MAQAYSRRNSSASFRPKCICDDQWQSQAAPVEDWLGATGFHLIVERDEHDHWLVNAECQPEFDGLH